MVEQLPSKMSKNILALNSTAGGDAHAAYRIARFGRRSYKELTVFVPGLCKSAGTLLCTGADQLVISETGELGPIDVQVREQNDLFTRRSGLAVPRAMNFLEARVLQTLRVVMVDMAGGGPLDRESVADRSRNRSGPVQCDLWQDRPSWSG